MQIPMIRTRFCYYNNFLKTQRIYFTPRFTIKFLENNAIFYDSLSALIVIIDFTV